jgi:hypothetical protein
VGAAGVPAATADPREVAAAVLTERRGYTVTAAQLWPGRGKPEVLARSAVSRLDGIGGIDDAARPARLRPRASGYASGAITRSFCRDHDRGGDPG